MIRISPLLKLDMNLLEKLIRGYVSWEKYQVSRQEDELKTSFALELIRLETPYKKHFELDSPEAYKTFVESGFSFLAYDGDETVGLALAEGHYWNQSLWIYEFHILESYQGKGIGRQLMETLAAKAKEANLRIMVCETQNTNVSAIRFYRKLGFRMDALDLSLYSNQDYPDGEIAIFMKRTL